MITRAALLLSLVVSSSAMAANTVLVEAESFDDKGGWKVDQQFMDQMGSPFLLAHGYGKPVRDATTRVTLPAAGELLSTPAPPEDRPVAGARSVGISPPTAYPNRPVM